MPLIQGKSKKAVSENIKREMAAGKPQKQSIAIALSVKRKNQKKAKGGEITANQEGMTNVDMARDDREMHMMRKKMMADGGRVMLDMADESADDAADADAMSMMHKRKMMAQGGTITANEDKMVTVDDQDMPREKYADHDQDLIANDEKHYTIDDYSDARSREVLRGKGSPMHAQDIDMLSDKMVSIDDEDKDRSMEEMRGKKPGSHMEPTANDDMMTKADDAKTDRDLHMIRMAEGGMMNPKLRQAMKGAKSVADAIRIKKAYAEGGEVDLEGNADESPNMEDRYNYELLRDKNYPSDTEASALDDLDYDVSKSVGDDLEDEDMRGRGIVSSLRKKMRMR